MARNKSISSDDKKANVYKTRAYPINHKKIEVVAHNQNISKLWLHLTCNLNIYNWKRVSLIVCYITRVFSVYSQHI